MKITYIYTLSCPITDEVRYVGKALNPKQRYNEHLSPSRTRDGTHKSNWIKSLLLNGMKPTMHIIDETINGYKELEIYWISQMKTWGFNLTNLTLGGDGTVGHIMTDATKEKIRKKAFGRLHSSETKQEMSKNRKGKIKSQEHKDKLNLVRYGRPVSEETK